MKMTMHIDEADLAEVIKITGVESKTKAVEAALKEIVRKSKFKRMMKEGLGLSSEELKNVWEEPVFGNESLKVAETSTTYARKRTRR